MTIAEKILRAKADYDAVYEAGKKSVGEVLKFTDVESTAYRSTVPNGVEPFARVNKIGGMSYKTNQLPPFEPYFEGLRSASVTALESDIDTLVVPEAVKSLDGYGLGVNSEYYNYIDFERKVFVQNVYRKVFDGTEDWYIPTGIETTYYQTKITPLPFNERLGIMNRYNYASVGSTGSSQGFYLLASGYIRIRPDITLYPDDKSWKAHLAELYASGNPLIVDYVLAEPIETDISAYLTDEYIEVEGGGTITAVNEYGYDAPTNISYLIDTQGG